MIIYTQTTTYFQKDEDSKAYTLFEATTYKGKTTSDRVIIWDEDTDRMVGFVYGANGIPMHELDRAVESYVEEYEAKQAEEKRAAPCISYHFTKTGISAFSCDVVDDILDHDITGPYTISHGNRSIELPDLAQIHELLENFLEDALEEAEA